MTQGDIHREFICRLPEDTRLEAYGIGFHLRRPADLFDVVIRDAFEPDGLPDSRRSRVPDSMGLQLPVLLAPGLGKLVWIIPHLHRHGLLSRGVEHMGDIGPERRMAALVRDR